MDLVILYNEMISLLRTIIIFLQHLSDIRHKQARRHEQAGRWLLLARHSYSISSSLKESSTSAPAAAWLAIAAVAIVLNRCRPSRALGGCAPATRRLA
eukprot:6198546-Pleurochrysis_carterae.AAC.1